MTEYIVTGMSCAACSARVEKAVSKVAGVTSCAVSLLTNSMGVEGGADTTAVIAAVEKAGYAARLKGTTTSAAEDDSDILDDTETPPLRRRLLASLGFLAVLMYVSMGHMMLGWPLPDFLAENMTAQALLQMVLATCVMVINQRFFTSGTKSFVAGAPNMDTLVALGSGASFFYSLFILFKMTAASPDELMPLHEELYFESAAMILSLITVGKMLEARSKGKTTDALKSLIRLAPKTATVVRDGVETTVPVASVKTGDIFVVRPGESIPVDGVVIEGSGAVNEAALTGESLPVDKEAGDEVASATMNQSGFLKCRATRVGSDTTLARIIQLVQSAAATKAPIGRLADKVSGVFVPAVIALSVVTTLVWLALGEPVGFSVARGISVLVISCPCALGLATPVAIMAGSGVGARHGILFKTAAALEAAGKTETVALDKTGTITSGTPSVTDIVAADGFDEAGLLRLAAALEAKSEHPLARAVISRAEADGIALDEVTGFTALPGNGIMAYRQETLLLGGSQRFVAERVTIPREMASRAEKFASLGRTPLFFAEGEHLAGMIAAADVIKPDSRAAIAALRAMGIRTVMLTGDNERTANAIAKNAQVDEVVAGVLPDGKESVIRRLKEDGKTAMVGDGINDAPALAAADSAIAIGAGADVAIDAADVVLMKSSLMDVPAAIRLSRATLRNIKENLFWAFIYNLIGIPLAAGVFIPVFGIKLTPMFGAAAMSLSSFSVVTNALRLNFIDIYQDSYAHVIPDDKARGGIVANRADGATESGVKRMEKLMKIDGMTCGHCEKRVKKVLEALPGVESAEVSHEKGEARLTLSSDVDAVTLKKAVEDEDYTVLSVA